MRLTKEILNKLILETLSQDEFETAKDLLSHEGMLLYALEGLFGDLMYPEELPPPGEPDEHGFIEDPAAFHVDETFEIEDYDFGDFKLSGEIREIGELAVLVPSGPRLPEMEIIERLQKVGLAYQTKDKSIIVGNEKDLKIIKSMDLMFNMVGIKIPSGAEIVQTKERFTAHWEKEVPIKSWYPPWKSRAQLTTHTLGARYVLWHDEFSLDQGWDDVSFRLTSKVIHRGLSKEKPPNETKSVVMDVYDDGGTIEWEYRFYNQDGSKVSNESKEKKKFSSVAEAIEEAKKYLPGIEVVLGETN
jgi:hypothetical protein